MEYAASGPVGKVTRHTGSMDIRTGSFRVFSWN